MYNICNWAPPPKVSFCCDVVCICVGCHANGCKRVHCGDKGRMSERRKLTISPALRLRWSDW